MSVSLKKGCRVSLSKEDSGLKLVNVALGWDCNDSGGSDFDLDAWAMVVQKDKGIQRKNLVYFGNTLDKSKRIKHLGDNLTGAGDGDDETIEIDLKDLPKDYIRILVGVTIFRGKSRKQTFANVNNTFIRIYNRENNKEICKYEDQFTNSFGDCVTMLFGYLEKLNEEWEFVTVGEGSKAGTITEMPSVFGRYELIDIDKQNNKTEVKNHMAVSLSKGGKVSLAKVASDAGISKLSKILVGLGWDTNRYDGGEAFDLDASVFMLGANGKVRSEQDFIFYNNLVGPGVQHMGDERTGGAEGDDEQIKVDLDAVPADVEKIAFTVTIHDAAARGQNFGMVENSFIHIADEVSGTDLIRYDLGEDFSIENTIVVAELYRHNGEWKFNAIGSGFSGGLQAICANFGVDAS